MCGRWWRRCINTDRETGKPMKAVRIFVPLLILISGTGASASQGSNSVSKVPPDIVQLARAALPAPLLASGTDIWLDASRSATGKLDASSREYFALKTNVMDHRGLWDVAIFLFAKEGAKGTYRLLTRSPLWAMTCGHLKPGPMCNDVLSFGGGYLWYWREITPEECDIIGRSDKCLPLLLRFQFRKEADMIRLIGLDVTLNRVTPEASNGQSWEPLAECSVNYVTRRKITWKTVNGRRVEHATEFELQGPLTLGSFVPYSELTTPGGMRADLSCHQNGDASFD